MRVWIAAVLGLLLVACAHAPDDSLGREAQSGAGENPRARIHTELAAQYFLRGQHAVALQGLDEALKADANYAPAHNMLGLVYADLREDAKAEASFKRAIALQRNYSEAHNNYGWFLCQRGQYDASIKQFELALTNPLYVSPERALTNAGLCSLQKGDLAAAEDYLQRALRRMPNQPAALLALADLHARQGHLVSARNLLKQAAAVSELDARGLWLGVRVERQLGDRTSESSYASQLKRRFPDSEEAHWLLSGQYDQPGGRP
ncbi:MAG: type IV pilus biogenesis/stability protein PilW [Thiobacillaceae bacterium]